MLHDNVHDLIIDKNGVGKAYLRLNQVRCFDALN
jgi:hypothetical protein